MSVKIVPLRQKHIHDLTGATSPFPFVGLAGLGADGSVLGVGGLVHQDGVWIAGLNLPDDGLRHPVALMKSAKRLLGAARAGGLRVVAFCDPEIEKAAAFMERIGFRRTGKDIAGEPEWVLEG